jgi:integrase
MVLIASGRRQTIGHYPTMSLADARREARRLLAEKQLGKIKPRFTAWDDAKERYLTTSQKRPKTIYDYRRQLAHFPFDRSALADVSARDILRCLHGLPISEKRHAFAAVRTFLKWCVYEHLIDRSPCESLKAPPDNRSRERVLSPDELKTVYAARSALQTPFACIVSLLLLTGQRRGEIAGLQWSWIDDQERTITFPSTVTTNKRTHVIPYGDLTTNVFLKIPRLVGSPYLFPAARQRSDTTTVFNGFSKAARQLKRDLVAIDPNMATDFTLHDIRRGYSTIMASLGVSQIVVEKLLNHVTGSLSPIATVYNRYQYMNEMRDAVARYETYLQQLVV